MNDMKFKLFTPKKLLGIIKRFLYETNNAKRSKIDCIGLKKFFVLQLPNSLFDICELLLVTKDTLK